MIQFAKFTPAEQATVEAIVHRAYTAGIISDELSFEMDISAACVHCPMRLADWLAADAFNFAHDVIGIRHHINRTTGELDRTFLPRFAVPARPSSTEAPDAAE